MPGKYLSLRVHFIWSTLQRQRWILPEMEDELYRYIGGIFRNKDGALIEAGGDQDHIHLYASLPSTVSVAEIVNAVKSNSSGSMKGFRRDGILRGRKAMAPSASASRWKRS